MVKVSIQEFLPKIKYLWDDRKEKACKTTTTTTKQREQYAVTIPNIYLENAECVCEASGFVMCVCVLFGIRKEEKHEIIFGTGILV